MSPLLLTVFFFNFLNFIIRRGCHRFFTFFYFFSVVVVVVLIILHIEWVREKAREKNKTVYLKATTK